MSGAADCWQTCNPTSAECGKACASATAAVCADDVAIPHQTGRIVARSIRGDRVHFRFAGADRVASVDELVEYGCFEEHRRLLDEYERQRERERAERPPAVDADAGPTLSRGDRAPPPSPDPAECYSGPE